MQLTAPTGQSPNHGAIPSGAAAWWRGSGRSGWVAAIVATLLLTAAPLTQAHPRPDHIDIKVSGAEREGHNILWVTEGDTMTYSLRSYNDVLQKFQWTLRAQNYVPSIYPGMTLPEGTKAAAHTTDFSANAPGDTWHGRSFPRSGKITIQTVNKSGPEQNRCFILEFSWSLTYWNPVWWVAAKRKSGDTIEWVCIQDRDPIGKTPNPPQPSITAVSLSHERVEEGGTMTFTAEITQAVGAAFEVTPYYAHRTTEGADFSQSTQALAFKGDGAETKTFTVQTTEDTAIEGVETFKVGLQLTKAPSNDAKFDLGTGIGTITDDDYANLTISDASATEGGRLEFTLTLDAAIPSSFKALEVQPRVTAGTATAGTDYAAATPPPVTFAGRAGEKQTVRVSTLADTVRDESDETLTLSATRLTSAPVVTTDTGTGTIKERTYSEVGKPALSISGGGNVNEGSSASWTITLDKATSGPFAVTPDFTGTATKTSDYKVTAGTRLSFAGTANEAKTITIAALKDGTSESDETVLLGLETNHANRVDATATGSATIKNVDPQGDDGGDPEYRRKFTIKDVTVTEGGNAEVAVTYELSKIPPYTCALDYDVTVSSDGGTATSGSDYKANIYWKGTSSATHTFRCKGLKTKSFVVETTDDSLLEGDETVQVKITVKNHHTQAKQPKLTTQAVVTITDNDTAGLSASNLTVNEGRTASVTVTATGSAVPGGYTLTPTLTIPSFYTSRTLAGRDYDDDPAALVFAGTASETETLSVDTYADGEVLPPKQTCASFTADHDAVTTSGARPCITIVNTDQIVLEVDDAEVDEDDGTVTITVTSRLFVHRGFDARIEHDGTGSASTADYTINSSTYETFAGTAGETKTFTVTIKDDTVAEGLETFGIRARTRHGDAPWVVNSSQDTDAKWNGTVSIIDDDNDWLSVSDAEVEEGGNLAFQVKLTKAVQNGVTLKAAVQTLTGEAGSGDFTDTTATLTFTGTKDEEKTFSVATTEDTVIEDDEALMAVVSESGANKPVLAGGLGTITDDDSAKLTLRVKQAAGGSAMGTGPSAAARASVRAAGFASAAAQAQAAASGEVYEGHTLTYEVVLDKAVPDGFSVTPAFTDGTAVSGNDYSGVTGALSFAGTANETKTFTVRALKDSTVEGDETYSVSASVKQTEHTVTTPSAVNGQILDIDGANVTVADVSAAEGDTMTFTVRLNKDVQGGLKVTPTFTDGTAKDGTDYTKNTSKLTFTGTLGEKKTFTVATTENTVVDADKTFTVGLNVSDAPSGITAGSGTGTITNDDTATVTIANASNTEGSSLSFTATLSTAVSGGFTVTPTYTDVSTTSGTDYTATTTALAFSGTANESKSFTVSTTQDTEIEGDETFTVTSTLSKLGTGIDDVTAVAGTGTVTDDDSSAITLSVNPSSVAESASGTSVTVTAATDGDTFKTDQTVSVSVGGSGTATSGTDYAAVTNFDITITAGQTSATGTFTLTPTQDTVIEGDETIGVAGTATGLTVNGTTVTLTDDDNSPITLSASPASVGESASATSVTVTAATDGDTFSANRTVTVTVGNNTDSATSGTDYAAVTNFDITITAGQTSGTGTFTLTPTGDTVVEGNETITVAGTATGLTVNGTTVTLSDDDTTDISLTTTPASVGESAGATDVTVRARTDGDTFPADRTVTVTVGETGDGATSGTDYAAVASFDITITAGQSAGAATFSLTPTGDTVVEGDESITVAATSTGLTVNGTSMTLTDDDTTEITLSASPSTVTEDVATAPTVTVTASTDGDTFAHARTVTVSVGDSGDGATAGTDYTAVADFDVTISAGEDSGTGTFTLTPTQDTVIEGDEKLSVDGTATNLTVNGTELTITDDESSDLGLAVSIQGETSGTALAENGPARTVTVTAKTKGGTFPENQQIRVTVGASGDGATAGVDYESVSAVQFNLPAGQSEASKTFTLTPKDDTLVEGNETITVAGSATGREVTKATITLTDNDAANMSLAVDKDAVAENDGETTVTVTASTGGVTFKAARTVTVSVGDDDDGAASGTDYTAVTDFDVTIAKGQTSGTATFKLTPADDKIVEGEETLTVAGTTSGDLTVTSTTMKITDNDASDITLTVNPATVAENASATTVTVTAATDGDTFKTDQTVAVTVGTSDDGATSGTDYAAVSGFNITITAGQQNGTHTFTLTPTQDTIIEGDETITVAGTAPDLTVNGATVTLSDEDTTAITLEVSPASVAESAQATEVTVKAKTDGDTFKTARTVAVSVGGSGTATSGTDYAAVSDFNVTIAAGQTEGTANFTLTPTQDTVIEGDETLGVAGTSDGLTVNGTNVTLTDDDSTELTLSTAPSSVSEGTTAANVTVTVETDSSQITFADDRTVTVTVGASGDAAASGTDYEAVTSFDITITAGQSQGTGQFALKPTNDTEIEGDEKLTVAGASTGLTVKSADVTLTDDDSSDLTLSLAPATVGESAAATTVTVTASTDGDTFKTNRTVTVSVGAGTATSGTDYAAVADFDVTLTAGQTSGTATFTLTPTTDTLVEGDETITVSGTSADLTITDATLTLSDDDGTGITLTANPSSVAENAAATLVTVTAATDGDTFPQDRKVMVTVGQTGDTAIGGTDYATVADFEVTITKGQTSSTATFTLTPTDNDVDAADKAITLPGTATGLTVHAASLALTDDDDTPSVDLTLSPASVMEDAGATQVTVTGTLSNSSRFAEDRTVTVTVGKSGDSAVSGTDYAPVADFDLTIQKGDGTGEATFTLTPTEDQVVETSEQITVHGASTDLTVGAASLQIKDDPKALVSIALTASPSSVAEDAGATTVTVTAAAGGATFADDTTVTVTVGAGGDTATSGTDYTAVSPFGVTIATGQTSGSRTFTFTPTDDDLAEGDEALTLSGTAGTWNVQSTKITLTEDDAAAGVTLSASPSTVAEDANATTVEVTATLAGTAVFPSDTKVTVAVGTTGTAVSGTDYKAVADFEITIPKEQSSGKATFELTPMDDAIVEENETIGLSGTAANLTVTGTDITLTDADGGGVGGFGTVNVRLDVIPDSVNEGGGARRVRVSAEIVEDVVFSTDQKVLVIVGGPNDTAVPGVDYAPVPGFTVVIPAGEHYGSERFVLSPIDDDVVEPDKWLEIHGTMDRRDVEGTYLDFIDDDFAFLSVADTAAPEGMDLAFSVTLSAPVEGPVEVLYGTSDGTARSREDYRSTSGTLTLEPLVQEATVYVETVQDDWAEPDETMTLSLAEPPTRFPTGVFPSQQAFAATGTIENDDIAVISVAPASADEGDPLHFDITMSARSQEPVSVSWETRPGTATAATDYRSETGTHTFAPGETDARLTVATLDDDWAEAEETMTLALLEPPGGLPPWAAISETDGSAAGTIASDDVAEVSVTPARADEGSPLRFAVSLSTRVEGTVHVAYATADGTATANFDYEPASDVLLVPLGETAGMIEVTTLDDIIAEDEETLTLSLSPPAGGFPAAVRTHAARAVAVGTIASEDVAVVTVAPAEAREGSPAEFLVSLSTPAGSPVALSAATVDGTANVGSDYESPTAAVTVPAGHTTLTVAVETLVDGWVEGDETFELTLRPAGALPAAVELPPEARGGLRVAGTIVDVDVGLISVEPASMPEGDDLVFEVTLSAPVASDVSLAWNTQDGTATVTDNDYVPRGDESLVLETGTQTAELVVATVADFVVEEDETLDVRLAQNGDLPPNVSLASPRATGTIEDDDGPVADRLTNIHEPIIADLSLSMTGTVVEAVGLRVEQGAARSFEYAEPMTMPYSFGAPADMYRPTMQDKLASLSFAYTFGYEGASRDDVPRDAASGARFSPDEVVADDGERGVTVWGRGDLRYLGGAHDYAGRRRGQSVEWDGEVFGVLFGADANIGERVLAGAALSHFESTFDYDSDTHGALAEGVYETLMTSIHPYANWRKRPGLDLWATAGLGTGGISFREEETFGMQEADAGWMTGALGGKLRVGSTDALIPGGTTSLDLKAEGWITRFRVRDNGELIDALDVDAHRLRLAAEAEYTRPLPSGGALVLSPELAARRDGGDGENGAGLEVALDARFVSPGGRLGMGGRVHTLAMFSGDKQEWGVSTDFRMDAAPDGRGLSFELVSSYGADGMGVGLWDHGPINEPRHGGYDRSAPQMRLDGGLGYGMRAFEGRGLVTLRSGLSWHGEGRQRRVVGTMAEIGRLSLGVDVERIDMLEGPEYGVLVHGEWWLGGKRDRSERQGYRSHGGFGSGMSGFGQSGGYGGGGYGYGGAYGQGGAGYGYEGAYGYGHGGGPSIFDGGLDDGYPYGAGHGSRMGYGRADRPPATESAAARYLERKEAKSSPAGDDDEHALDQMGWLHEWAAGSSG